MFENSVKSERDGFHSCHRCQEVRFQRLSQVSDKPGFRREILDISAIFADITKPFFKLRFFKREWLMPSLVPHLFPILG